MKWKEIIIESVVGTLAWTGFLTPYVIFITNLTFEQYLTWLGMQFILVPPITPLVFRLTNKIQQKLLEAKKNK